MSCRRSVPIIRHTGIERHSFAGLVKLRQIVLGPPIAVRGRARIPQGGFGRIARRAKAAITHHGDVELGENKYPLGGAPVPNEGCCRILPNTLTKVIEKPEAVGRSRIATFGEWPPYSQSIDKASRGVGGLTGLAAQALLRYCLRNLLASCGEASRDREKSKQGSAPRTIGATPNQAQHQRQV